MTVIRAALWRMAVMVLLPATVATVTVASGTVAPVAAQEGEGPAELATDLVPPWNFVTATEAGSVDEVFTGTVYVEAVFRWDASREAFDSWQKALPASLNSLPSVERGDALWVRVGLAETWRQADAPAARPVDFVQGWNTFGWTGPNSGASEVASLLGADVVIGYDAASQAFLRYAVEGPSFLNSLVTVRHGDGLWAFLSAPGSATIPASGAPSANGDVIEEEPVPMELTSAAFGPNETIPSQYTCDGADLSPPLTLSGIPADAVSLALIMDDPDAPGGTWVHWVEFNIAPRTQIPTGAGVLGTQGRNSFGTTGYGGPCPPSGTHRYFFTVYALSAELELAGGATKAQVLAAMEGLVLAQAELIGLFR